ncbi:MAG: DNA/RNA non-specific endonuclease [Verrucomicrobia bacterium]|nr:DNA/RNA non-specific endonuclease [Verrucomicrobiota bacterium]
MNRNYWLKFERHVRDLTNRYDTVQVITDPLYMPQCYYRAPKLLKKSHILVSVSK